MNVAIPQRRGSELPITAILRSGVMSAPRHGPSIAKLRQRVCVSRNGRRLTEPLQQRSDWGGCRIGDQGGQSVGADFDAGATAGNEDRLPDGYRGQSDRRMAVQDENPCLRSASSAQLEPSGSSSCSRTKCRLATRSVRSAVRRVGLAGGRSGQALATATPLSSCNSRCLP